MRKFDNGLGRHFWHGHHWFVTFICLKAKVSRGRATKMPRFIFFTKLWDYPQHVIFHLDTAPLNCALPANQYLNEVLGNRLFGRSGSIACPPRSPYLIPRDFILWSYTKARLLTYLCTTISKLKTELRASIASITEQTLQSVLNNTKFGMRLLQRQNRAHFKTRLYWVSLISLL